ncbi:MAG: hypothetical protein HYT10_00850 [Candidatus Levybacteria bacterium]|nr:hypothetical protein [Candidatus Levybacteria bacterium]
MAEQFRAVSMAFALVDEKIQDTSAVLPRPTEDISQIDQFLELFPERVKPSAGGSVANVMTTFAGMVPDVGVKLYTCVGNDVRGEIFAAATNQLVGEPQIDTSLPTGTCVFLLSQQGEPVDEITYYGAAENVQIPNEDIAQNSYQIFVSNVNTFRHERAYNKAHDLLKAVRRDSGLFVLRLSGAHSVLIDKDHLQSVLSAIRDDPEIVFANRDEVKHITGSQHSQDEITNIFPNARVFLLTLGAEGSLLRYEGKINKIPPVSPKDKIVDTTGAGDAYMGAMLGMLSLIPYTHWTQEHVYRCARAGAFAAGLVIQSFQSRMAQSDFEKTKLFFAGLQKTKQE